MCKKLFSVLLLFLALNPATFSQGQDTSSFNRFDYSLQLSVNRPFLPQFRDSIYNANLGVSLGFHGMWNFHNHFSLSSGVNFTRIAYSRNAKDSNIVFLQTIGELYGELPVNLWFWPDKEQHSWGFHAGVMPSVLLIKNINQREMDYSMPKDPSTAGRFDLSAQVGARVYLSPRVSMTATYYHSFTNYQNRLYNSGKFSYWSFGIGVTLNSPNRDEEPQKVEVPQAALARENMFMLVRLNSGAKKMERLIASGQPDDAAKLKLDIKEENDSIIAAFTRSFNICPVYFFYDTSSRMILNRNYSAALFDNAGNPVNEDLTDTSRIFIAEFGSPFSETFRTASGYGLVVFNYQFIQMQDPFPYYTANLYGLLSKDEVVRKFNNRLGDLLGWK